MSNQNLTCIAIDDDPLFLLEIEHFIKQIGWLKLLASVASPVKATTEIVVQKPDIVFLDIEMPYIDGYELIDWIEPCLNEIEPRPKVFIVTANKQLIKENDGKSIHKKIFKSDLKSSNDLELAVLDGLEMDYRYS